MEYIYIGKIVNTHGIKGELRIKSNFEKKDLVFKPNMTYYIGEEKVSEEVTSYRHHKEFEMVTFKGYDNINQVLKYLKKDVYVNREDLHLKANDYICFFMFAHKLSTKIYCYNFKTMVKLLW